MGRVEYIPYKKSLVVNRRVSYCAYKKSLVVNRCVSYCAYKKSLVVNRVDGCVDVVNRRPFPTTESIAFWVWGLGFRVGLQVRRPFRHPTHRRRQTEERSRHSSSLEWWYSGSRVCGGKWNESI